MSYYDPPEENCFLGCPVCQEPSEDTWVDVSSDDPKSGELLEPLRCKSCGIYFDFAQKHHDVLFAAMATPPVHDTEYKDLPLSPEESTLLELARQESEIARLKEIGYMTEDGELTDDYYRAADHAYDCAKGK